MTASKYRLSALLLGTILISSGCDSNSDGPEGQFIQISGAVSDDAGYGKSAAPISDADVEGEEYDDSGEGRPVEGSDQTDASGRYVLGFETSAKVFAVTATSGTFRSATLVARNESSTSASAIKMTSESYAEANVFAAARGAGMTTSHVDVVAMVDSELAAEIESGATTSLTVAGIIRDGAETEEAYMESGPDEQPVDRRRDRASNRDAAFISFQTALSAAANVTAEQSAIKSFENGLVSASVAAGIPASVEARASQAGRETVLASIGNLSLSANARLAVQKRASLRAAAALRVAIETSFEAFGSASNVVAEIRAHGEAMSNAMISASSEAEINAAASSYNASIEAQLIAEANISSSAISVAKAAAISAESVLANSLSAAVSATAKAEAYANFFASFEAALELSFASNANASFGASVLTQLALN